MQIRLERVKSIGRKIGLNDEKGFAVAIFLALVIVSLLLAGYYLVFRPQPAPYSTIYLLDLQKKAVDYQETLVANQNSSFSVWVNVENHVGSTAQFQVLTKITSDLTNVPASVQPVNTTTITLKNGQSWQSLTTITQNQVGSYSVVFELWQYNTDLGAYQFTNNACVLNIQVIT